MLREYLEYQELEQQQKEQVAKEEKELDEAVDRAFLRLRMPLMGFTTPRRFGAYEA